MKDLLSNIKIIINSNIYIKDPESSDLGRRIVGNSIILIDEVGFEDFTFKKLGKKIGSNESSIYRYFESKHKLLIYLTSWYWAWVEYQMVFETNNILDKKEKLRKSIEIITRTTTEDSKYLHIDEVRLNRIMINENSKSFLTKEVDQENKEGYFMIYKRLVNRIQLIISEANPHYIFAGSLASSIVEGALHQHFLKDHFPSLTDCKEGKTPTDFFMDMVFKVTQ
ncbi:hypothetical protein UJ101_02594 [Flavobacteriaceae bacterium UJ101]|nr:hypothetical protein UJ101_02594 [Flavobacteriaceae bacterium UJ101]